MLKKGLMAMSCVCVVVLGLMYWFLPLHVSTTIALEFMPDADPSPPNSTTEVPQHHCTTLDLAITNKTSFNLTLPPCLPILPCDWTTQSLIQPTRLQAFIHCEAQSTSIFYFRLRGDDGTSIPSLNKTSQFCLTRVINDHCYDKADNVPRIAHYVRFGEYNLSLDAFFSVLSVARNVQPCLILFHGDVIPTGPYWRALVTLVPNIVHVQTDKPVHIFGNEIQTVEHSSDVTRIRTMLDYGGIYLDTDYLVMQSLDVFLNDSMVMGKETSVQLSNAFFIAEMGANFLSLWLANYTDFMDFQWAMHSTIRPCLISQDYPNLIRVVDSFFRPNYGDIEPYFDRKKTPTQDWSDKHGLHLYTRMVKKKVFGEPRLDRQDNVIGEVVRTILFGDPYACGFDSGGD